MPETRNQKPATHNPLTPGLPSRPTVLRLEDGTWLTVYASTRTVAEARHEPVTVMNLNLADGEVCDILAGPQGYILQWQEGTVWKRAPLTLEQARQAALSIVPAELRS